MDLCERLPYAEECFPFNEETLVYKIGAKMFALIPLEESGIIILKHSTDKIEELKESVMVFPHLPICPRTIGYKLTQKKMACIETLGIGFK